MIKNEKIFFNHCRALRIKGLRLLRVGQRVGQCLRRETVEEGADAGERRKLPLKFGKTTIKKFLITKKFANKKII